MIAHHEDGYPVRLMCRVVAVSVSGYSAHRRRPERWRAVVDDVLMAQVRIAFAESGETYGAPRVHHALRAARLPTSTNRVARLMREAGLTARPTTRRRVITTDSAHADPIAPNRLARQFDVHGVALNQVWVGDITYIPMREGLLYWSTVLDLGSRRCVGWAMRDAMNVDLVTSALRKARQPAPGVIFHSDRGSQYASETYRAELAAHGMLASMSGKGNCYDNAVAERFFATLEFELVMRHDWHIREEARRAIFRYIETWYNRRRRHPILGCVSLAEYEAPLLMAA